MSWIPRSSIDPIFPACSQGSRRGRKRKGTPPKQQQDNNGNPGASESATSNGSQQQSPNSNPFQRAPLSVLKKTGESFLQVGGIMNDIMNERPRTYSWYGHNCID